MERGIWLFGIWLTGLSVELLWLDLVARLQDSKKLESVTLSATFTSAFILYTEFTPTMNIYMGFSVNDLTPTCLW